MPHTQCRANNCFVCFILTSQTASACTGALPTDELDLAVGIVALGSERNTSCEIYRGGWSREAHAQYCDCSKQRQSAKCTRVKRTGSAFASLISFWCFLEEAACEEEAQASCPPHSPTCA